MAEKLHGGCLCGRVRFSLPRAAVSDVSHCHCRTCQRASGAGVVSWVTVPETELELSGATTEFASSETGRRRFCPACGTQLVWSDATRLPGQVTLTLASFDDGGDSLAATDNWYCGAGRPWVKALWQLPAHEEGPP